MADSEVLFTNVKIIDGSGAAPYTGEVLVRGKRISRVAKSARSFANHGGTVIDGAGATLMPGMVEAHTHFAWNNASGLSDIQKMRSRNTPVTARVAKSISITMDVVCWRGNRETAARCRRTQCNQRRIDPRPALQWCEPGDHRACGRSETKRSPHLPFLSSASRQRARTRTCAASVACF